MTMARSTSPPAGAAPSATSCGSMPRACASAGASSSANKISRRRIINVPLVPSTMLVEVGQEPAFRLFDRNTAAHRIILQLVAADPGDAEILAVAMPEVESADRRSWQHREILGQRDLAGIFPEHIEQDRLQAVVGAGGIAGGRPDALIFFPDELLVREVLVGIAPQPVADLGVEDLREALGQPVGERLQQD